MSDLTTDDHKKRAIAIIAEVDPVELGVRLFEAVVGIMRPEGLTAEQCFAMLPADDKPRVLRAARVAGEYMAAAISSGVKPS